MTSTADMHATFVTAADPFLPQPASIVETLAGFDVVECKEQLNQEEMLLIWFCGRQQHAYWAGHALITDDGEAIEGDALDDVRLVGVVTHTIYPVSSDENPFM